MEHSFLGKTSPSTTWDGDGTDSNFSPQLYILQEEEDNPILNQWRTEKKTDKYVRNTI